MSRKLEKKYRTYL